MRTIILFLLCLSQGLAAGNFFEDGERFVWLDNMYKLDGATTSPSGNCLAFHKGFGVDSRQYRGYVYFMTPEHLEPIEIWRSGDTEATYFQCLDDMILLQPDPKRFDVVYKFDLVTGKREVYLDAGMQTNLGTISEVRWFQVDDMDQSKHYFIGTVDGLEALYRVDGKATISMVIPNDELLSPRNNLGPQISGNRLLSTAQLGTTTNPIIRSKQTNLETGEFSYIDSGEAKGRSAQDHYFMAQLTPFGNLYYIQTRLRPYEPNNQGIETHVFRIGRGNFVPNDPFEEGGPELVVSHPYEWNYIFYPESSVWGKTGFTMYTNEAPFGRPTVMLEDGNVLMKYGDRLPGNIVAEDFGRLTSSRNGIVLPVYSHDRHGNLISGLRFFPVEPAVPVEEHEPPVFTSENVVNAASYESGPIAPDEWVAIGGENLVPEEGTTRVFLDGMEIIPIYSSPKQINILTPMALPETSTLSIVHYDLEGEESTRHEVSLETARYAPGLFQYDGQPIISDNRTFGLSDEARPLPQGGVFNLWGTGFDDEATVIATVGDRSIEVLWVGRVGAGLMQINIVLPSDIIGDVSGEIRIANKTFSFSLCVESH